MKIKKIVFLLVAVLSISLLAACSPKEIEQKLDAIEETVEQQLDNTGDKIENAITPNANNSEAKITAEEAQAIALEHAGFAPNQVNGLHAEYEVDDGIAQYDVSFRRDYLDYDYEINAETGEIISFDMDD